MNQKIMKIKNNSILKIEMNPIIEHLVSMSWNQNFIKIINSNKFGFLFLGFHDALLACFLFLISLLYISN